MQVTQTLAEGLKREFKVVVPASDIASRAETQLVDLKDKVRINGFRPGKVPVAHLRRLYGKSVLADVVNSLVGEVNQKIVNDNNIKLAMEPKLDFGKDDSTVAAVMEGSADLAYNVTFEILPTFEVGDLSGIALEKPVAAVSDEEIQSRLEELAKRNRTFTDRKASAKAATGDRVIIDFLGKIDGTPFDGGAGSDISVDLGSDSFIPGFEEQLIGVKAGEEKLLTVTFPEEYPAKQLAGKLATFDVTVKSVQEPGDLVIDDEMAKSVGMESLDELKKGVSDMLARDLEAASRRKMKRQLLDALDAKFSFDLPPTLVEQEFNGIWTQIETEMKNTGKTFADENTTEEKTREDYQKIAARRVRLGLVLAEVGSAAAVQVTEQELGQAVIARARQFPGQERQIWDAYQKNPQALTELRAPLFEDKVVDHLIGLSVVTEKPVSKEELMKDEPDDETL